MTTLGARWQLRDASALGVDNLTVVAASGRAGAQWVRVNELNLSWQAQAAWFVDPANAYGTSSDENTGAGAGTALRSYAELNRRLWHATITTSMLVTCRSNFVAGDIPEFNFATVPGVVVTFEGVVKIGHWRRAAEDTITAPQDRLERAGAATI